MNKNENKEVSEFEIVELFYGKYSLMHRAFLDKLHWDHNKFLLFIKTCSKFSELNSTTTYTYDEGDGWYHGEAWIYKVRWKIHVGSFNNYQLNAIREESAIRKDGWNVFNTIACRITICNRAYQVKLVDDDKEYFGSVNHSVYKSVTIKKSSILVTSVMVILSTLWQLDLTYSVMRKIWRKWRDYKLFVWRYDYKTIIWTQYSSITWSHRINAWLW